MNPLENRKSCNVALRASAVLYRAVRRQAGIPVAADLSLDLLLRVAGGTLPLADLEKCILRTYVVEEDGEIDLQQSKVIDLNVVRSCFIRLQENYDIQIPALVNNALSGVVTLDGQVQRPGKYTVGRDETLHDIIERAGGFTEVAYPLGSSYDAAIFESRANAREFNPCAAG